MAHGGTNFGFWSGANVRDGNDPEDYIPLVTSYDYSAPLSEAGDHNVSLYVHVYVCVSEHVYVYV